MTGSVERSSVHLGLCACNCSNTANVFKSVRKYLQRKPSTFFYLDNKIKLEVILFYGNNWTKSLFFLKVHISAFFSEKVFLILRIRNWLRVWWTCRYSSIINYLQSILPASKYLTGKHGKNSIATNWSQNRPGVTVYAHTIDKALMANTQRIAILALPKIRMFIRIIKIWKLQNSLKIFGGKLMYFLWREASGCWGGGVM